MMHEAKATFDGAPTAGELKSFLERLPEWVQVNMTVVRGIHIDDAGDAIEDHVASARWEE